MAVIFQHQVDVIDQVFSNWPKRSIKPLETNLTRNGFLQVQNGTLAVSSDRPVDQRLDFIFSHLTAELKKFPVSGKLNFYTDQGRVELLQDWRGAEQLADKVRCIYQDYCLKRPWYLSFLSLFFSCFSKVDASYQVFGKLYEKKLKKVRLHQDFQAGVDRRKLDQARLQAEAAERSSIHALSHVLNKVMMKKQSENIDFSDRVYTVIAPKQPMKKSAAVQLQEDTLPLSIVCMPERKLNAETIPAKVLNLNEDHTGVFKIDMASINDKEFGKVYADSILEFFRKKTSSCEALKLVCDTSRSLNQNEADFIEALHQIELLLPSRELDQDCFFAHSKIEIESSSKTPQSSWSEDFELSFIICVYEGKKMDQLEESEAPIKKPLTEPQPLNQEIVPLSE